MEDWKAIELARRYVDLGRGERALEALARASAESTEVWLWRANALHELRRYDEALHAARAGLAIDPEASYLHHAVARAHNALGQRRDAEDAIRESVRLNPDDAEALAFQALLLSGRGKRAAARRVIQRAAELDPESRGVRVSRALIAPLDSEAAVRMSGELLQDMPEGAYEHWLHGQNLVRRGKLRVAANHFARAASLEPANAMYARSARITHHWFFWPLRITSPVLYWLAPYTVLPLWMYSAEWSFLWPAFWGAVAWTAYGLMHGMAHFVSNQRR